MSALARSAQHNNRTIPMSEDQLSARHRLLVEYMLHGCHHASLCARTTVIDGYDPDTGIPNRRHPHVGEPLDLMAAAEVLRIKRRHARSLSAQPVFQRLLAKQTQDFRTGAHANAVRRMVALIDEPGQGKAADRKVQLQAAAMTLGEIGGGTSISITNTVGVALAPGYILDLEERDDDGRVVEHQG